MAFFLIDIYIFLFLFVLYFYFIYIIYFYILFIFLIDKLISSGVIANRKRSSIRGVKVCINA